MIEGTPKKILLVEDEVLVAKLGIMTLEKYGFSVVHVDSGEKAIETVENTADVDLVLMDINLGEGIDGTEAAEKILARRDIPLIFLSSHTSREVVEKAERITSYGYIVKSSCETVLVTSIKMAFRLFDAIQNEKAKENALRMSEEKYRLIVETANEGIACVDADQRLTYVNRRAAEMFGYEPEEAIGKKVDAFLFPADVEDHIRKSIERPKKGNEVYERRFRKKDGTPLWTIVSASSNLIDSQGRISGSFAMLTDITERKKTEEVLRFQAAILDQIGDHVTATDMNGKIIYVNEAECKVLGKKKEDVIGFSTEIYGEDPNAGAKQKEIVEKTLENGFWRGEVVNFDSRNNRLIMDCRTWKMLDSSGNPLALVGIASNITERKLAEAEIKRQLSEKEIFLKEVHHRIKNNIASVEGFLFMQAQTTANPEAMSVLRDAIGRVQSMRIIYDKLLQTSDYRSTSLKDFLEDLIDAVYKIFPDKEKVTIEKRLEDFPVVANKLFILGSFANEVLTNSMKYAFVGMERGIIRFELSKCGDRVTFIVRDNGVGLPAGIDLDKSKGFGIMLAKMLGQQLGGTFKIENGIECGTVCTLEFDK